MKIGRHLSFTLLLATLPSAASAMLVAQNGSHCITAGDFGIAFVDDSDNLYLSAGGVSTPLQIGSSLVDARIVAADVTGDGQHDVVYSSNGTLFYYDTATGVTTAGGGGNITDVTVGTFFTGADPQVVVAASGGLYRYNNAPGNYTGLGGGGVSSVMGVNFNPINGVDEFETVANGSQPWLYTPNGSGGGSYNLGTGGIRPYGYASGDLDGDGEEEAFVLGTNTSGGGYGVYYGNNPTDAEYNNWSYINTGGFGLDGTITVGDGDGDGIDEGYVVGTGGGIIWGYNDGSGWAQVAASLNSSFYGFVVQDLNGDGTGEFYGKRTGFDGELFRFDPATNLGFYSVPEPGRAMLLLLGTLALGLRRRR